MISLNACDASSFVKPAQPFMPERTNHRVSLLRCCATRNNYEAREWLDRMGVQA